MTKFLNNIAFRKALIELCKQNTQFEQVQRQITDIIKILLDNQDNRQIEKVLKINDILIEESRTLRQQFEKVLKINQEFEDENTILRKELEEARQALAKLEESNPAPVD